MTTKSLDQRVAERLGMDVQTISSGLATHFYDAANNYTKLAGYWTDDLQRAVDLWDDVEVLGYFHPKTDDPSPYLYLLLGMTRYTIEPMNRRFRIKDVPRMLVEKWLEVMETKVQS